MRDIVAVKLRALRNRAGIPQKELARISGVGEKTISSFEASARMSSMKLAQLRKLLCVYGLTEAEFFARDFTQRLVGDISTAVVAQLAAAKPAVVDENTEHGVDWYAHAVLDVLRDARHHGIPAEAVIRVAGNLWEAGADAYPREQHARRLEVAA